MWRNEQLSWGHDPRKSHCKIRNYTSIHTYMNQNHILYTYDISKRNKKETAATRNNLFKTETSQSSIEFMFCPVLYSCLYNYPTRNYFHDNIYK